MFVPKCALELWTLLVLVIQLSAISPKPHVIVMLADDLGWNDVSLHGSNQIPTPNIDALAYNGIILNNHYVQALCTPSRAAFLTGKYPIHTGMQHSVILEPEPRGLPLTEKLLPEYLREAGYATHAVGKWHLGYFKREYTPTYRGFDTHFGYWNGLQDYFDHTVHATFATYKGYDMRRNMSVDYSAVGKYSTDLFGEEAVRLIHDHDVERPMFLYLAHLAPHTGNQDDPLQAPDEEIAKFSYIEDPERRIYAAMVSMLDKSVGDVVAALRAKKMLENSIVIFLADNGAPTFGIHANHGSNYPLRGMKASPWEGGNRGVGAIWSPLLNTSQRVSDQFMHVTDWLPTLMSAAGLSLNELVDIDGIDMWKALSENRPSPRTDAVVNIDTLGDYAAYRRGEWKYIIGSATHGNADGWYGHSGNDSEYIYNIDDILQSKTGVTLTGFTANQQIKELKGIKPEFGRVPNFKHKILTVDTIKKLREKSTIRCNEVNAEEQDPRTICRPMESPCLFNIKEDPCETTNLASTRKLILHSLEESLHRYRETMVKPSNVPDDPKSDPILWNNTWTTWQDCRPTRKPFSQSSITMLIIVVGLFIVVISVLLGLSIKGCGSTMQHNVKMSPIFQPFGGDANSDEAVNEKHRKTDELLTEIEIPNVTLRDVVKHID